MIESIRDFSGPLAGFPLTRTGPSNAEWRRSSAAPLASCTNVARIRYSVIGSNSDAEFPYVDGIPSLRDAIDLARIYPGIYHDGAATHILREVTRRAEGARFFTGLTHRWRAFPDGQIELLLHYSRHRRDSTRVGLYGWQNCIGSPPPLRGATTFDSGKPLGAELSDLRGIAHRIGYMKAAEALRSLHAVTWRSEFQNRQGADAKIPVDVSIDAAIRPVCDALNRIPGVRTLWSCGGHALRRSRPYVVFEAPEAFALKINRMLWLERHITLTYRWNMTANFKDSGELQWLIEAPGIPRGHYWPIARRRIDAELLTLASLISEVHSRGADVVDGDRDSAIDASIPGERR
ncbi:hypothetical protein ACVCIC_01115 [Burkholderia glumae]|uniref:hypothetical protein n=1 Tax=Burkholderia glumae TaxID=337 RepID=UPI0020372782|nr:hypothetical protein [Burkholderia glumae]MCM2485649.1 hypothetical protein [Burkholderia glumae]MCM2506130.1 hypothetical protein [Burkholderia glumae]